VIIAWVAVHSAIYFLIASYFGWVRVSLTEELIGLDISEMDANCLPHINDNVAQWKLKELGKKWRERSEGEVEVSSCPAKSDVV
jgi:hypothetical protein